MNKKNILLIIDSLGIGGAEKVVLTLAQGFLNENYQVDLISVDNIVKFDVPSDVNLHILDFKKGFLDYYRYSKKLHKLINNLEKNYSQSFDLILVNLQKSTRLMKRYNHKNIYHIVLSTLSQSAFKNRKGIKLYLKQKKLKSIYNNLNILADSDGIQDDLLNAIQIKPKTIKTIYSPVDFNQINQLSKEKNIIKENNYILHIGRFATVKRHDILLQAYKQSNIEAKLVLVGDGEEKENILNLIDRLNLNDKVILTGLIKNPYPVLKNATLLVLSSEYEGLPTVILEAFSLNIPVVSTNCPSGPSEILKDELSQYLVKNLDIDNLALKIAQVYKQPYDIPKVIMKQFESNNIIKQYEKLINE
jgi:glycosyltransferase involved in cell wall biosynthesis